MVEIKIYNKYNQLVYEGKKNKKQLLKIQTKHLPNDIYFLHIIEENGVVIQKQLIIQK
jgi:hypothetical protein